MHWRYFFVATALILLSFAPEVRAVTPASFEPWLTEFSARARTQGITDATLQDAFAGLTPNPQVIALDRKQPEGRLTEAQYLKNTVTPRRIAKGKALLKTHAAVLEAVATQYQVPKEVIVALWGIETDFGGNKGRMSVIRALATLAMEGRRKEFFESELLIALQMLQNAPQIAPLLGSWAGAMGHCQFMPSSYAKYAVDWDKNGHADIWNSLPDSFASIAHYLHEEGWNPALKAGGNPPNNRDILLKWNRSSYFVKAVGLLSEKIAL